MNIKAIIASLVLGSSSVALAAPSVTVSATARGSYEAPVVRDHRIDPIGWNGGGRKLPPVYRPVTLASGVQFAATGRTSISVGSQAGSFGTLQISAASGRTFIKQVYVQFANGQTQVLRNLDRTLAGNESMTLDLDGGRRNISRIVVYGSAGNASWRRTRGAFTVIAS
jgi:hypothetical protein